MNFWDRVAGLYDWVELTNRRVNSAAAVRVARLVPEGARVLDCAAGTGLFALAAARRADSVLCTDLSQAMLSRAEKKACKQGLSNICFAVRDLTALPEGNGSFDVVIAANVLHLLPEPETAVRVAGDRPRRAADPAHLFAGQGRDGIWNNDQNLSGRGLPL